MTERRIAEADLIAALPRILEDITANGVTYLVVLGPCDPGRPIMNGMVSQSGEVMFALGRPADLSGVLGLVDPEYGWPYPVQIADITAVGDVAPGYRRHPMLYRGRECMAMSVTWWEYQQLRGRGGEGADPGAAAGG